MSASMPSIQSRRVRAVPRLAAVLAAIVGLVNLASAVTPTISWRGHVLLQWEPVEAIPVFHALTIPAGVALCVAALYLARRRRRAWQVAFALLLGLGALNLLKGLDFEEAILCFGLAGLLWWGRAAFTVEHEPLNLEVGRWRTPLVVLPALALAAAAVALAVDPDIGLAGTTVRASHLLLGELGLLAAYLAFRPLRAPRALPDLGTRALARELVLAHGEDTLSFFKLREDKHYLFSPDRRAFVGYRVEAGVLLISGDPVGPEAALPALMREVLAFAEVRGLRVGGVGASEAMAERWEEQGLKTIYLGDEALVDTGAFSLEGRPIRKVRQSVTRLSKAGYAASIHSLADLSAAGRWRWTTCAAATRARR